MFVKVRNLIQIDKNAKTIKGQVHGVMTGIMYLAPHTLSGYNVCPKASEGCKLACLYTAGRGIYSKIQKARLNKTRWFFEDRISFMETLVKNISSLERIAAKNKMIPAVRLNGTSDIAWEKIECIKNGIKYKSLMEAFPNVQFFDYTAILGRKKALKLENYSLTFSLKENNDNEAKKALKEGYNVAVVFDISRKDKKPTHWSGYKVINGDAHDIRFNEGNSNIVGLFPKGKAKKDITGFVRSVNSSL